MRRIFYCWKLCQWRNWRWKIQAEEQGEWDKLTSLVASHRLRNVSTPFWIHRNMSVLLASPGVVVVGMLTRLEANGWKAPHQPQLFVRRCEKRCVPRRVNPTVFLSLPEWLSVPCRSFHIQRLVGGPCLEVAGWGVAVAIRTSCTRRSWYTGLPRNTRRSPLPVATIATIARFARLACDRNIHFRLQVAPFRFKLQVYISRFTHQGVQEVLADL